MRGTTACFGLIFFAWACGNDDVDGDGGLPADTGFDGGYSSDTGLDVGVGDNGRTDSGDAGFVDPSTLTQGYEKIAGLRTWMHIKGSMTSTLAPVVFIASGPGHGFEYLIEPTKFLLGPGGPTNPNRLLVYFDLAGIGLTPVVGTGSMTSSVTFESHLTNLDDTIAFANSFSGRTGPVDIIGHGYGAGLAAVYATRHPDTVRRLVLVAPYPTNVFDQANFQAETTARLTNPENNLLSEILMWNNCLMDIPRCGREYWNIIGPHWMCRDSRSRFSEMDFRHFEIRAWTLYIPPYLRMIQYDWLPQLQQVQKPTTIIDGPCDITPLSVPQIYKDAIAGSRLYIIPNSGHFPMVETSTTFQAIVKRALN